MYELAEEILRETDGRICKNCLGRKLSKTVGGANNIERADKVCQELGVDLNGVECSVCDNLFDKINDDLFSVPSSAMLHRYTVSITRWVSWWTTWED